MINTYDNYEQLQEAWMNLIINKADAISRYSIYKETDGVFSAAHNLDSVEPLHIGVFKIVTHGIDYGISITNPTIKDIANAFHHLNNGHHVFLEDMEFDLDHYVLYLTSGS